MTNKEYFDDFTDKTAIALLNKQSKDAVKHYLEEYAQFVLTYDMMEKQADMFGMSVVEYRNHMESLLVDRHFVL